MITSLFNLFNINVIALTILGYSLSWLELSGTVFNLASVWLAANNKVSNWPIGIIGAVLFGILFYQVQLYADMIEQVYYFITGFWGWYLWSRPATNQQTEGVTTLTRAAWVQYIVSIGVSTVIFGYLMSKIHLLLPAFFPAPAAFPYLDVFLVAMCFAATLMLMRRNLESWYLWITVDVISIGLYAVKGVMFVSLLYAIYLGLAIQGYLQWRKLHTAAHIKEALA